MAKVDYPLSKRQQQVLLEISEGQTNEQIAKSLGISLETVKTYVKQIIQRLDANNRAHAVAKGYKRGYLKVGK